MVSVLEKPGEVADNAIIPPRPTNKNLIPGSQKPEGAVTVLKGEFLRVFAENGGIVRSSTAVGTSRRMVEKWLAEDGEFAKAYTDAIQSYREHLEQGALLSRLSDPKCPPLLVIFALKGAWREKYGDDVHAVNDAAGLLLKKLEGMKGGSTAMQGSEVVRGSLVSEE